MGAKRRAVAVFLLAVGIILAIVGTVLPGPKVGGVVSCEWRAKSHLITGAYKAYGIKECPRPLWLAKSVFTNSTNGRVTDLRVRYRLSRYADWCRWHEYPAVDPGQTVVDLYHPLLDDGIAQLTSRTPGEIEMEYEYTDPLGGVEKDSDSREIMVLSRREFIYSDLPREEQTGSFQDRMTSDYLLTAWVTSVDAPVAKLASMANENAGGVGATADLESFQKVMRELYDIMLDIRVTYQHPTVGVDARKSLDITGIQSVQYPRDTIEKRSGTCIDLAILYAAMMESVGIRPLVINIDHHTFPVGVAPNGDWMPVEATCVGGGGEQAGTFDQAVKIGLETLKDVRQSGRYSVVNVFMNRAAGISCPELPAAPADVLEEWGVVKDVEAARRAGGGGGGGGAGAGAGDAGGGGGGGERETTLSAGNWSAVFATPDGSQRTGMCQITGEGGPRAKLVFTLEYSMMDQFGTPHQCREVNTFHGEVGDGVLTATCNEVVWTMDGEPQSPMGLPFRLQMTIGGDGSTMTGTVQNATGQGGRLQMQFTG